MKTLSHPTDGSISRHAARDMINALPAAVAHNGQGSRKAPLATIEDSNGLWKVETGMEPPLLGRKPKEETQKRLRKITMFWNALHVGDCFKFDSISKEQVHRYLKKELQLNNGADYRITIANKENRWYRLWRLA